MKLRTKYILFVVILHLVALVLSYFIFDQNKIFFIASEAFIIISIAIATKLYQQLIRPLKMLMQGVEAIKDRDFNVKFLPTGKHEMDELIGVYNQMIDVLRTERVKQEQQHFFLEKLIQTSPTGIVILDYNDHIQQINPKALQILSVEEKFVIGQPVTSFPFTLLQHIANLKSAETKTIRPDGVNTYKLQKSHFIDRGFPRHFIMIEELTTEILAAEKNVYGKVIKMMAHEVNNTVGPVNSIMESTLRTQKLWEAYPSDLLREALQVAIDRNQNLNLFMRNFAELVKLPEANKKHIDLCQLVGMIPRLMNLQADEKQIALTATVPEKTFIIFADEQQLEQALLNIVKNGLEAIGSGGSVTLNIDAKKRQLTVTDTGKGITAQESELLFTPFYTTKKDGQGIGLMLVREIMLNHGFEFSLKTVAENCTEFVIGF